MEAYIEKAERIKKQTNESRKDLIDFINAIKLTEEKNELFNKSLHIEQVEKFYKHIVSSIEETYQIDKELAIKLIKGSWMPEIAVEITEYFFHYSSRKWAEDLIDWALTICRKD